jgi:hypothetical protein
MLQDKYLPIADVCKKDFVDIYAPVEKVFSIVETLNFEDSKLIYFLFKSR